MQTSKSQTETTGGKRSPANVVPPQRTMGKPRATIERLDVSIYRIPTKTPEADGTISWDSTTMVLVEAVADSGHRGIGFIYASAAAAMVIRDQLAPIAVGRSVDEVRSVWGAMLATVRNVGRPGIAATAISAVDIALWDLKARVAGQALYIHLGACREEVPIYGSGGFTTYSEHQLAEQLAGWVDSGISQVKMKIGKGWGTKPEEDIARIRIARQAIGPGAELFVDANGAYTAKQAIDLAQRFAEYGVSWFEEPVSSDQLSQLALIRQRVSMRVAAGEYGYDPWYFRDMLRVDAVDVLQADATRCLGFSGWLEAGMLAHSFALPFSAHTAPSIHAQIGCVVPEILNVEYFYDHARIEEIFFEGLPSLTHGCLRPDPDLPGLGFELKRPDVEKWRIAR